jgi:hypothetical protein
LYRGLLVSTALVMSFAAMFTSRGVSYAAGRTPSVLPSSLAINLPSAASSALREASSLGSPTRPRAIDVRLAKEGDLGSCTSPQCSPDAVVWRVAVFGVNSYSHCPRGASNCKEAVVANGMRVVVNAASGHVLTASTESFPEGFGARKLIRISQAVKTTLALASKSHHDTSWYAVQARLGTRNGGPVLPGSIPPIWKVTAISLCKHDSSLEHGTFTVILGASTGHVLSHHFRSLNACPQQG